MKAIITDLDRTLLHTDKSLSDTTIQVLKECKEKGILVVAATARPERAVTSYQEAIGFDALITLNGAKSVLPNQVIDIAIPKRSVIRILEKLENVEGAVISLETCEGIFSNVDIPEWQPTVFETLSRASLPDVFYKVLVSSEKVDLSECMPEILEEGTYYSVANGELYQIMNRQATKWNGITKLLDVYGIEAADVVYFGDDQDDVEPIRNCGLGVAVANAIAEVKAVADLIVGSNDEDGVANFLMKKLS